MVYGVCRQSTGIDECVQTLPGACLSADEHDWHVPDHWCKCGGMSTAITECRACMDIA